MVISKEDKILIERLYGTNGYGACKLLNGFCRKKWTKGSLGSLITCSYYF